MYTFTISSVEQLKYFEILETNIVNTVFLLCVLPARGINFRAKLLPWRNSLCNEIYCAIFIAALTFIIYEIENNQAEFYYMLSNVSVTTDAVCK